MHLKMKTEHRLKLRWLQSIDCSCFCYYWKWPSQDTLRILQTCWGNNNSNNNTPLECLWLLCGCSECSCETAMKVEKLNCALDLRTAMRGVLLRLFLSFFLLTSPSSFFCSSWSKSHFLKWGEMIIVMDILTPASLLLFFTLHTFCSVH